MCPILPHCLQKILVIFTLRVEDDEDELFDKAPSSLGFTAFFIRALREH
jgi:hypothetical protein